MRKGLFAALAFLAAAAMPHGAVPPVASADEPVAPEAQLQELIAGLDDDRFARRQECERLLIALGSAALPAAAEASVNGSAETRWRAKRVVWAVQRRQVLAGFTNLAQAQADDSIDLVQGMWLISRIVNPQCRREDLDRQLDALAERVRKQLGVAPHTADPQQVVAALRQVLFVEEKFTGNIADYNNPGNSSLERVLATHVGLPILLSHVVLAVAERLELPIVGLPVPSCYLVKYDGARAPAGRPSEDIILNPFEGGQVMTVDELEQFIVERGYPYDAEKHLKPGSRRAALERMLTNLVTHLSLAGRSQDAALAEECLVLIDDGIDE